MAQPAIVQTIVSETLAQRQARYERYFDKKVRSLAAFTAGQMDYDNRPPLTILTVDREASAKCKKLLPSQGGPFKILEVQGRVWTIDEDRIENTISIDRAAPVDSQHHRRLPKGKKPTRHTATLYGDRKNKFSVHKIVGHRQTVDRLQYQVRWYGYEPEDDTFKLPSYLSRQFISRHFIRQK